MRNTYSGPSCNQHGVTMILVVVVIVALVSILGLAMNVGHVALAKGQLQNASDSGALAGVKDLGGNDIAAVRAGLAAARTTATIYSGYHVTDSSTAVSTPDVCLGRWDLSTNSFECISTSAGSDTGLANADVYRINAIRVTGARNATQAGGPVGVIMSGLFGGRTGVDVTTNAIAARFGTCAISGQAACPIAFAACQIESGMLPCGEETLLMSSATVDTMGLTVFSGNQQANGPSVQDYLMNKVNGTWTCDPSFGTSAQYVNTSVKIQNGNALQGTQSAVSLFDSLSCLVNQTCDAAIANVSCIGTNAQYSANGDAICGFIRITVTAVDPVNHTITIRRDCGSTEDVPQPDRRCQDFGLLAPRAYLIK